MKKLGDKFLWLLIVLGTFRIISVFRLQQPPADVTTPREHDIILHTTADPQLPTESPQTAEYRYRDDIIRGEFRRPSLEILRDFEENVRTKNGHSRFYIRPMAFSK